jgi:predicted glycoside hydrolase/deacetylase ChbG (UPF0249 family)
VYKQLIVNADDFGFTAGTNAGILEAHTSGILTASTLMAGGAAFDHAVSMACATPSLDVGVHLVLWDDDALPQRLPAFLRRAASMSTAEIERLFAAQVEKVLDAGIHPSHLDTHKHTHVVPHVMSAMEKTALRFGIVWVRRSLVPMTRRMSGIRTADHFIGLRLTGRMNRQSLGRALDALKPGLTELMCHPARYDADLEAAPTRLKQERQRELEALTAPEIRAQLDAQGIQLTNYREA